jgi:hypothetical protein
MVHTDDQQIVLKSSAAECRTVLVPHASGELYDAELELLWYRDQDALRVLDLRTPNAQPVAIARGMPEEDRLRVSRGKHLAAEEDGCDTAYISLSWGARPKIKAFLTEAPELELVNTDWLHEQLKRRLRKVAERQDFSEEAMPLPDGMQACELEEDCGTTVGFGSKGLQLVRVVEETGGDCVHQSCLLYDPQGRRWASPLRPAAFGAPSNASPGPCGLFLFDQAQSAYLVERWLCSGEQGCRNLDGYPIGWLEPGDTVGAPGLGDWQEP